MKVTLQIMPKIGCHTNVPKRIKKEVRIKKIHTNTFHLVKIWWFWGLGITQGHQQLNHLIEHI